MRVLVIVLTTLFISCSGSKETPESIAEKWCDLHKRMSEAQVEVENDKLKEEIENFEKNINDKYGSDDEFMKKLDEATEKCQDEIEGNQ